MRKGKNNLPLDQILFLYGLTLFVARDMYNFSGCFLETVALTWLSIQFLSVLTIACFCIVLVSCIGRMESSSVKCLRTEFLSSYSAFVAAQGSQWFLAHMYAYFEMGMSVWGNRYFINYMLCFIRVRAFVHYWILSS